MGDFFFDKELIPFPKNTFVVTLLKTFLQTCAASKSSDQPALSHFAGQMFESRRKVSDNVHVPFLKFWAKFLLKIKLAELETELYYDKICPVLRKL